MLLISKRGGLREVENSFLISLGKNVEEKRIPYRPRLQTLEELQAGYRKEELRSWARTEKSPRLWGRNKGMVPRRHPGTGQNLQGKLQSSLFTRSKEKHRRCTNA